MKSLSNRQRGCIALLLYSLAVIALGAVLLTLSASSISGGLTNLGVEASFSGVLSVEAGLFVYLVFLRAWVVDVQPLLQSACDAIGEPDTATVIVKEKTVHE